MRVALPIEQCQCDPQREHWATLDESPLKWGQRNAIRRAIGRDFYGQFAPLLVTMVTTAWSEDGDPNLEESWEAADGAFGDLVFAKALKLWESKEDDADVNPTERASEN